jgi:hypothetical protein
MAVASLSTAMPTRRSEKEGRMYGWGVFLMNSVSDDVEGMLLKAEQPIYSSVEKAKAAGMREFDSMIVGGIETPELLQLVIFDVAGQSVMTARARRVAGWN